MASLGRLLGAWALHSAYAWVVGIAIHSSASYHDDNSHGSIRTIMGHLGVGRMHTVIRNVGSSDQRREKRKGIRSLLWSPTIGSHDQIGSFPCGNRSTSDYMSIMTSPYFQALCILICVFLSSNL